MADWLFLRGYTPSGQRVRLRRADGGEIVTRLTGRADLVVAMVFGWTHYKVEGD